MTEYEDFCRFKTAMMGEIVPGKGEKPTPFVNACIDRALAILEQYFPEDAEALRAGWICSTMAHSPNGWMTRPMGGMLRGVEKKVTEMRNPHPKDTDARRNMHAYFCMLGIESMQINELSAWGRGFPKKGGMVIWMKSLPGCPEAP
jgi:hypothetical protein